MKKVIRFLLIVVFLGMGISGSVTGLAFADAGHGAVIERTEGVGGNSNTATDEPHALMEKVMRDCGQLSRELQAMFESNDRVDGKETPTEIQQHQAQMKRLLHEIQGHMEDEVRMLEKLKAEGLGHEVHHQ